jgi:hypothetical protein
MSKVKKPTENDYKELLELVDGAKTIVEIFKTDNSPYNKIWKENWLKIANKHLNPPAKK